MKRLFVILLFCFSTAALAQVGINTTSPNAQLEIRSSNELLPTNTDGLLIPKVTVFPATDPTIAQQGMLVFLTTLSGSNPPGFYYWNNPTLTWILIGNNNTSGWNVTGNSGTNPSTNFVGTIDNQDVVFKRNNIESGRISNSNTFFGRLSGSVTTATNNTYIGTEAGRDNISGNQNVYMGRRAGTFGSTGSNNVLIGNGAGILNEANQNTFVGSFSGNGNSAGVNNSYFGFSSGLSGDTGNQNTFFGAFAGNSNTVGSLNTSIGSNSNVGNNNLSNSAAIGANALVGSNNSMVLGSINGVNGATANVNVGIGTSTPDAILHIRNTPLINTINGTILIESNQVNSAANISFRNAITSNFTSMGMLANGDFGIHQGCNFGGCIIGIEALRIKPNGNIGVRTTNPLDELHVVGNIRMVDGNQGSGRVLISDANGTASWTASSTIASGSLNQAYDFGGAGLGRTITADQGAVLINGTDGLVSTGTSGSGALAPSGAGTRMVWNPRKAAFRAGTVLNTDWDDVNIGVGSVAFGFNTLARGNNSVALGTNSTASPANSFVFGEGSSTGGLNSITFGYSNNSISFGETVFGIGATTYTVSTSGSTQFRTANATDRLFVIGNAIDANNNFTVDAAERRDAMVVLKNGNTGIGSSTPVEKLQVAGKTLLTNGFSADNAALLYRNDTDYMFLGPQSGSSANGAAMGLFGNTNASGGNAGGVDFNVPNGQVRINHTNGNFVFQANSTSGYTSTFQLNDVGLQIGHNSNSRAIIFNTLSERMRITPIGDVGISTSIPTQRFDVGIGNIAVTQGDIYLGNASGVFNAGGGLMTGTINYIGDAFVLPTVVAGDEDLYIGDDIELGGNGFKPGGGAWVAPSDKRLKQNIQSYSDGLASVLRINPVTYQYNTTFKTLDTGETYVGVIAQEVQEIAPYMVNEKPFGQIVEEDENGNEKIVKQGTPYLTFDSSALTYMLINAVKEINVKYEEVKNKNKLLENKLNALSIRIETLEKN